MAQGKTVVTNPDDTPVEFMVDFIGKKRTADMANIDNPAGPSTSKKNIPEHFEPDEGDFLKFCEWRPV